MQIQDILPDLGRSEAARAARALPGLVLGERDVGLVQRLLFGRFRTPILWPDELQPTRLSISGTYGAYDLAEQLLLQQTLKGRGWIYFEWGSDPQMRERLAAAAKNAGREGSFFVLSSQNDALGDTCEVYRARRYGTFHEQALCLAELRTTGGPAAEVEADRLYAVYALTILLEVLQADPWGGNYTLHDLADVMLADAAIDRIAARIGLDLPLGVITPSTDAFDNLMDFISPAAPDLDKISAVLSSMAPCLSQYADSPLGRVYNATHARFDLSDIVTHDKMLYVQMRADTDAEAIAFARMMLRDMQCSLNDRLNNYHREKQSFLALLDAPTLSLVGASLASQIQAIALPARVSLAALLPGDSTRNVKGPARSLIDNAYTRVVFEGEEGKFVVQEGRKSCAGKLLADE